MNGETTPGACCLRSMKFCLSGKMVKHNCLEVLKKKTSSVLHEAIYLQQDLNKTESHSTDAAAAPPNCDPRQVTYLFLVPNFSINEGRLTHTIP